VISSDIIVHVRDIAHSESDAQRDDVLSILRDLGIGGGPHADHVPAIIELWNKADLLSKERHAELAESARRNDQILLISAENGEGIDAFKHLLSDTIVAANQTRSLSLRTNDGAALAWLHSRGKVSNRVEQGNQITVEVSLSRQLWGQFDKQFAHSEVTKNDAM
jgi:GTPase